VGASQAGVIGGRARDRLHRLTVATRNTREFAALGAATINPFKAT
jgi:hypothetical protein